VAQSIARKVEVTVAGQERERLTAARQVSPDAYESYLKGRFVLDKSHSRADLEKTVGYFQEAIKKDPTFTPAYVGLATTYNEPGSDFWRSSRSDARKNDQRNQKSTRT
jgi:hypothetical protein